MLIGGIGALMQVYVPKLSQLFVGRDYEMQRLETPYNDDEACILVVYGRRRVGKTELIEHKFQKRNLLKFEGIEDQPESRQQGHVLETLAEYTENSVYKNVKINSWVDVFKYIAEKTSEGQWTVYFEELQWLAQYKSTFVSELKFVWDNYFRRNDKLVMILCGSSTSFMLNEVLRSKALYNRSIYELPLKELKLFDACKILKNRPNKDVMDAYLTTGGIPEYLKRLTKKSSVFLSLCAETFVSGGYFVHEYTKVFTSSLSNNRHYKEIIEFLSHKKFATRSEILKHLKIKSSGNLTDLLTDLVECEFIQKYVPYNLKEKSLLVRYRIQDQYLHFYFNFIHGIEARIQSGEFHQEPSKAIKMTQYQQWLGYAYERFCIKYHYIIAKMLGISGVNYRVGSYFSRKTNEAQPGYQIDLLFDRDDNVITICEIKYTQTKVSSAIIDEMEKKLERFKNPKNKTIQLVLITRNGATDDLIARHYFDKIITLDDWFNESNWL